MLQHMKRRFRAKCDETGDGARWHFHLRNRRQYSDETVECSPLMGNATAHASTMAVAFGRDGYWNNFVIYLTDAKGEVIARVPAH
jgi:hypothetical protein